MQRNHQQNPHGHQQHTGLGIKLFAISILCVFVGIALTSTYFYFRNKHSIAYADPEFPIYNSYRLSATEEKTRLMKGLEQSFERNQMFTRVADKTIITMETSSPVKVPVNLQFAGCNFMFSSYVDHENPVYELGLSKDGKFVHIFSATIHLREHKIITQVKSDLVKNLKSEELEMAWQCFTREVMQYVELICNSEPGKIARVKSYLEQNFNIYVPPVTILRGARADMNAILEALKKVKENEYHTETHLYKDSIDKQIVSLRMINKEGGERVMFIIVLKDDRNRILEISADCIPALRSELDTCVQSCIMDNINK